MMEKKLLLLDAMALIYRAYFAFNKNPLINSKGMNVSAISGFTTVLLDLLTNENPTHIGVAFDTHAPTERHVEFAEYKANRQETPEDIVTSIPYIKKIIEAFRIPVLEVDGYEADDIIGTIAKKAEQEGFQVYMITPDKDFGQLVSENIFMFKPPFKGKGFEKMGVPEILKKWEITDVSQVIDILGLWGDAVDNIPGIPGIGEKTAKKLIKEYGSMEGIIKNANDLKGKLGKNVKEFAEQGIISKKLATIICDTPIDFDASQFKLDEFDKDRLADIFSELEFRSLGKRIIGESFQMGISKQEQMDMFSTNDNSDGFRLNSPEENDGFEKTIENTPHTYHLIDTSSKQQQLVKDLLKQKAVCFDTETTGVDANIAELVGISFAFTPHEAYYVPISEDRAEVMKILKIFAPFFEDENILKIGQNIKYDMLILKWYDISVKGPLFDTMLAHYLIEPDMRHNLDRLSELYLKYQPVPIEKLIGKKGKNQKSMRDVDLAEITEYGAEDADITLQLKERLTQPLQERNAEKLLHEVEIPLIPVLTDMEYEGVGIDKDVLATHSKVMAKEILEAEKTVYDIAGVQFNLASPKQLGEVLFEKMQIPYKGKKTKNRTIFNQ